MAGRYGNVDRGVTPKPRREDVLAALMELTPSEGTLGQLPPALMARLAGMLQPEVGRVPGGVQFDRSAERRGTGGGGTVAARPLPQRPEGSGMLPEGFFDLGTQARQNAEDSQDRRPLMPTAWGQPMFGNYGMADAVDRRRSVPLQGREDVMRRLYEVFANRRGQ